MPAAAGRGWRPRARAERARAQTFAGLVRGARRVRVCEGLLIAESAEHLEARWAAGAAGAAAPSAADPYPRYTHCEIHPALLFGAIGSAIPFADSNQAPRNQFSCRQAKSAVGVTATTFHRRYDRGTVKTLNYPQRPLVTTRGARSVGADRLPDGMNAVVAIMCFGGYNQEDAILVNQASVDRGLFNSLNTTTYYAEESRDERLDPPQPGGARRAARAAHRPAHRLRQGGAAPPGRRGRADGGRRRRRATCAPSATRGYVQRPALGVLPPARRAAGAGPAAPAAAADAPLPEKALMYALVSVLKTKRPVVGDKFCSRHGQKGMTGLLVPHGDMPCTEGGVVPDLIMNPHAIPSRMTVGQFLECVFAKFGAAHGCRVDATLNDRADVHSLRRALGEAGFARYAEGERLVDPRTGRHQKARVFIGPTFCRRLVQQVGDKMFYRAGDGRVDAVTGQPVKGRGAGGALRLGEMERDALVAHGVGAFHTEAYTRKSDGVLVDPRDDPTRDVDAAGVPPRAHVMYVSDATGARAIANPAPASCASSANDTGFDARQARWRKLYDLAPSAAPGRGRRGRGRHCASVSALRVPKAAPSCSTSSRRPASPCGSTRPPGSAAVAPRAALWRTILWARRRGGIRTR